MGLFGEKKPEVENCWTQALKVQQATLHNKLQPKFFPSQIQNLLIGTCTELFCGGRIQ
jgi:hypothetical protein